MNILIYHFSTVRLPDGVQFRPWQKSSHEYLLITTTCAVVLSILTAPHIPNQVDHGQLLTEPWLPPTVPGLNPKIRRFAQIR